MNYTGFVELYDCGPLTFVARAVGKDDSQPQFWNIKVERENGDLLATATDGKRLHRAVIGGINAPGVPPGFWRVLKNRKVKERDYKAEDDLGYAGRRVYRKRHVLWLAKLDDPKYFDLFPSDDKINSLFPPGTPVKEGAFNGGYPRHSDINRLIKTLPGQAGLNLKYLKGLGAYEWKYKIYSERGAIVFEHDNKTALIMPLDLTYINGLPS